MKKINRGGMAAVAILVMLFAGLVNAWSVLSRPIGAEFAQYNAGQMSLTYTITMFCFCVGG
ncbi:MAG: MFS transporter, partial [Lachnospiraceae bacterium]|nr:MFS transporter [Lachnospiraceae bacterium]